MQNPVATVDIAPIADDLTKAFAKLREAYGQEYIDREPEVAHAFAQLETFCAISIHVMRHVRPSRLREAARAVEIKAHIHGNIAQ